MQQTLRKRQRRQKQQPRKRQRKTQKKLQQEVVVLQSLKHKKHLWRKKKLRRLLQ